jgi:hypothetical protein
MSISLVKSAILGAQPLVLPSAKTGRSAVVGGSRAPAAAPREVRPAAPAATPAATPVGLPPGHEEPAHDPAWDEPQGRDPLPGGEALQAAFDRAAEEGHAEGLRRAAEDFRRESERRVADAVDLLRDLARAGAQHREALQAEAVPVVVAAITQVFGELGRAPEYALAAVRHVLDRSPRHRRLCLRVAPRHAAFIREALAREDIGLTSEDLDVLADTTIAGGCRVDSEAGGIDATLTTQLACLLELLQREDARGD